EMPSIHDSSAIVHSEDDIPSASQVLIHSVGVVVVVHVVEAEHHLANRSAMNEDEGRTLLCRSSVWCKELTVDFPSIFSFEDDLFWRNELVRREISGQSAFRNHLAA